MVNFQVIKVDFLYNILLGRPWLHAVGAVASTLHRRFKFISENQFITIMAKEPMTIFQETSIPYIDAFAFLEASFHSFKIVSMIHNALEPGSSKPLAILMAVKEMLKFRYKLGQGLRVVGVGALLSLNSHIIKEDSFWGMKPLMRNSFKLLEERKGSVPLQGCLFAISGPLFGLQPRSLCQNLSRNWKTRSLI